MPRIDLAEGSELIPDMPARGQARKDCEELLAEDPTGGVALALSERPGVILSDVSLPMFDNWNAPAGSRPSQPRWPSR
jgi:hypothetical protein